MDYEAYNAGYQIMQGMISIIMLGLGVVGPVLLVIIVVNVLSLFADLSHRE